MNYKQRMIVEILDLKEKIVKLENFIKTKTKTSDEEPILRKQMDCMVGYYNNLQERIMLMLGDIEKVTVSNE